MTTADFIISMDRDISTRAADLIAAKPEHEKFLNYADMKTLSVFVRTRCEEELGAVPQQVIVACKLAEAVIAPSNEKAPLLREVFRLSRGLRGVSALISAIGTALGWSGTAIAVVVAFMTGASLFGAVCVSAVIGYFLFLAPPAKLSEKALAVLHQGLRVALTEHDRSEQPQR